MQLTMVSKNKIKMSAKEKLQKAIEATIAAGYQLNSEAFEFLSQNSDINRSS